MILSAEKSLTVARAPIEISRRRDELAALALDLDSMVERMGALVGAQRNLLSTVSHELRSPLARFSMALGLLRNQAPSEKRKVWEDMLQVLGRLGHQVSERQKNYFMTR